MGFKSRLKVYFFYFLLPKIDSKSILKVSRIMATINLSEYQYNATLSLILWLLSCGCKKCPNLEMEPKSDEK